MAYGLVDLGTDIWNAGKGAVQWAAKPDNMKTLGTLLGGAGQAYGAYAQDKYAKDLLKLQKAQYYRGIQREEDAEKEMQEGFMNSNLVKLG